MPRRSLLARALGALCMVALLVGVALSRQAGGASNLALGQPKATATATLTTAAASASAATHSATTAAEGSNSATAGSSASVAASTSTAASSAAVAAASTATRSPSTASAAPASAQIGAPYGPLPASPCHLRQTAFCDTFAEGAYQGSAPSRNGALDPARWSVARLTEAENPGQGELFAFLPTPAMFCQTPITGVLPDADSFMCNGTDGRTTVLRGTEDMHWMTAIDDGGSYATLGARILQPFDFAGRTGTIAFAVDLATRGGHSWWPSLMVSEQPVQLAHPAKPGVNSPPRNGFDIDFDAGCGQPTSKAVDGSALSDFPATTVGSVSVFTDYQEHDLKLPYRGDAACVLASRDQHNHLIVQVSQTSLAVYANDYTDTTHSKLRLILHLDQRDGFDLGFTRGYVSLEHSQYAGAKFNGESAHTFHWHAVGFDGPVLPAERVYQAPDALTPPTQGSGAATPDNIGYSVGDEGKRFTIEGVNPRDVAAAYVTFDWRADVGGDTGLRVRLNGGSWLDASIPTGKVSYIATNAIAALPISELRPGANTLDFQAPKGATLANIDVVLDPPGVGQPAAAVSRVAAPALTTATTATGAATSTSTTTARAATAPEHEAAVPAPSPTPLRKRVLADCVSTDGGKTWSCTPAP